MSYHNTYMMKGLIAALGFITQTACAGVALDIKMTYLKDGQYRQLDRKLITTMSAPFLLPKDHDGIQLHGKVHPFKNKGKHLLVDLKVFQEGPQASQMLAQPHIITRPGVPSVVEVYDIKDSDKLLYRLELTTIPDDSLSNGQGSSTTL